MTLTDRNRGDKEVQRRCASTNYTKFTLITFVITRSNADR